MLPSSAGMSGATIGNIGAVQHMQSGNLSDAAEALMALGYDKNSVLNAIKGIDATKDAGDIIREALKKLNK